MMMVVFLIYLCILKNGHLCYLYQSNTGFAIKTAHVGYSHLVLSCTAAEHWLDCICSAICIGRTLSTLLLCMLSFSVFKMQSNDSARCLSICVPQKPKPEVKTLLLTLHSCFSIYSLDKNVVNLKVGTRSKKNLWQ